MSEDRLYVNHVEHITSLLVDLLIFWIKSIYFIAESMYLTILPNRFRKLKVNNFKWFFFSYLVECSIEGIFMSN